MVTAVEQPEPSGELIDFDTVHVVSPMIEPPRPTLVVQGQVPHGGVTVTLVPLAYVSPPLFAGIQVVAHRGEAPQPQPLPARFAAELDLAGYTGSIGIEVVGRTCTQQLTLVHATQLPA